MVISNRRHVVFWMSKEQFCGMLFIFNIASEYTVV